MDWIKDFKMFCWSSGYKCDCSVFDNRPESIVKSLSPLMFQDISGESGFYFYLCVTGVKKRDALFNTLTGNKNLLKANSPLARVIFAPRGD